MIAVTESGLYTLALRAHGATTPGTVQHHFRRWVTSEVLPQIRATGAYVAPGVGGERRVSVTRLRTPSIRRSVTSEKIVEASGLFRRATVIRLHPGTRLRTYVVIATADAAIVASCKRGSDGLDDHQAIVIPPKNHDGAVASHGSNNPLDVELRR